MKKECSNCMYELNTCEKIVGSCWLHAKWKRERDIRKGTFTGVVVDFTDYKIDSVYGEGIVLDCGDESHPYYNIGYVDSNWRLSAFDKLSYNEYKQYLTNEDGSDMKYKTTDKKMTGRSVANCGMNETNVVKFISLFGYNNDINYDKSTEDIIEKESGWIEFLVEHGFLKLIKKEIKFDQNKLSLIKINYIVLVVWVIFLKFVLFLMTILLQLI